jgi:hypothetical protein
MSEEAKLVQSCLEEALQVTKNLGVQTPATEVTVALFQAIFDLKLAGSGSEDE